MSAGKRILGVIAGAFAGIVIIQIGDALSGLLASVPENLNLQDRQAVADFVAGMPVSCFLIMIAGYILGAFLGGLVATRITGREAVRPAITVGIILTIGGIFNLTRVPHPMWFNIVSTLVYIPSAWTGWRVLTSKPYPPIAS